MKVNSMVPEDHPLWAEQQELEASMASAGRDRFWRKVREARERGEEASTPHGQKLLKSLIVPTAQAIDEFVALAMSGRPGRRHTSVKYFQLVDSETIAYLALRVLLDSISTSENMVRTAVRIGDAIHDEALMRAFEKADKLKAKMTVKKAAAWTTKVQRSKLANMMAKRAGVAIEFPEKDRVHVGVKVIEIIRAKTGLIDVVRATKGHHDTVYHVTATEQTLEWIGTATERAESLSPIFYPTVVPPKPWTSPWDGGYWTLKGKLTLVKTFNRHYHEELFHLAPREVYSAVNAVQETPWKVNTKVLAVLKEAYDSEGSIGKLPARELPLPMKPEDIATNETALKDWKRAAAKVHSYNARVKSKRLQVRMTIEVADRFADKPAMYFPQQLDFRGRMYSVPMFLNPQGADFAKGLLTFANGKRIGDSEQGPGWLAIHGANVFGYDKASLEDRVEWVEQNEERILSVAADPWGPALEWWSNCDKPWQFLAFCFEWAGFKSTGLDYVSSLPVALDGSCNGLQHYSAALRDPVGGKAVNLLPAEKPQDIYAEVAEVVKRKLAVLARPNGPAFETDGRFELLTKQGLDLRRLATLWLDFGVDRKVTKRAVMTLPYGATQFSCREFIEQAIRDKLEGGKRSPFAFGTKDGIFEASLFLQPLVWEAIGEVVRAARIGMDWLKTCAKMAAKEGLPVCWTAADGFLVFQSYHDHRARRVETFLDGAVLKLTLTEELPEIDKRLMAQGIAPNWVHSMDATALRMYVNLAKQNGVQHFALVHDSYGTVAADVAMMSACLREAFIDLYTERDPLEDFRVSIAEVLSDKAILQLPRVPARGDLDLTLVRGADFFFA